MKIIDLLNRIAKDEGIPIKIKFKGKTYEWSQEFYDYRCKDDEHRFLIEDLETEDLNKMCEEILIVEDKKIVKLKKDNFGDCKDLDEVDSDIYFIIDKINEIIEHINKDV